MAEYDQLSQYGVSIACWPNELFRVPYRLDAEKIEL